MPVQSLTRGCIHTWNAILYAFVLLLVIAPPQVSALELAAEQSGTQPPSSSNPSDASQASSNGGLFGGTAELENGVKTVGAEAGVAKSGTQQGQQKSEFAIAPLPLLNPSIGNGMGGTVLYLTPLDSNPATPTSVFAIAGFGTGTGSWLVGLGTKLYLKNDQYRITAGYGGASLKYNYYGIGSDAGEQGLAIPFSQRSRAFVIEPMMRVFRRWYVGPRYHWISNDVTLNQDKLQDQFGGSLPPDFVNKLPVALPSGLNLSTAALGLRVKRDTSDDEFYPHSGSVLDVKVDFFDSAVGGQISYQDIEITYNQYFSLGRKNVLATHVSSCLATNGAPFFDICLLGYSKDLRGYPIGRYRDDRMLAGQAEFRRELFWRLGAVAFFGVGEVGNTFKDFNTSNLIPGGGVGLRYKVTKKNHLNLRADYAWGKNSRAFYMSVGEAF
jgi:Omp85 superfamily domain